MKYVKRDYYYFENMMQNDIYRRNKSEVIRKK